MLAAVFGFHRQMRRRTICASKNGAITAGCCRWQVRWPKHCQGRGRGFESLRPLQFSSSKSASSERSFGVVFCFPASGTKAGEAGGKQTEAKRSGLSVGFGMCSLFRPRAVSRTRRDRSGRARPQTTALDTSVRRGSWASRSIKSLIGVSMLKPNLCVRSLSHTLPSWPLVAQLANASGLEREHCLRLPCDRALNSERPDRQWLKQLVFWAREIQPVHPLSTSQHGHLPVLVRRHIGVRLNGQDRIGLGPAL